MKTIELKELELTNYRNIDFAHYEFDGDSKIIGENRIGKTNTLESIYWLLTDKLLDGSSEVSAIKPLKDTTLEVRVKARFDIDGKEVTLEKTYKENWVKTRGTTDLELKGHTITWIHNGVKQATLKAYNQLVSEDFGFTQDATTKIDFMQMLINPFYLGNIGESKDWTELRAFIIKLVGDVSDDDVVKMHPEYAIIKKDLDSVGGRVDQLKKMYSGEIDGLETTIIADEAQIKLLEETSNPTDDEVAIAEKGIEEHQDKINALKSANGIDVASMEINNKINDKKYQISELEKEDLIKKNSNSQREKINNEITELTRKSIELLDLKSEIQLKISRLTSDRNNNQLKLTRYQELRKELISKLKLIDSSIANPTIETECPHCHRPYDEKDANSMKELFIENANQQKEELIVEGKANTEKINSLQSQIDDLNKEIEFQEDKLEEVENELSALNTQKESKRAELESIVDDSFEPNPQIAILKNEIELLEEEYKVSRENYSKGVQNNQQLIYEEEQAMIPFKKVLNDREYWKRQMLQLETVKESKKNHSVQLCEVEQKKEMLNHFIYTKLKMLDENVSKVFGDNIRFQLIKGNINGGCDAVCKPYIYNYGFDGELNWVTWKSGSKSERLITGIAIMEKIKEKLDLPNLPYLFDEGGEVSTSTLENRMTTKSQLICVKVVDNLVGAIPLVQKL